MTMTRRTFMQTTAAFSATMLPWGLGTILAAEPPKAARALKLLILGGTGFLGPHLVEAALARGHTITLFNRGRTNPHLFPELEKLRGDRRTDLSALDGRTWDAVIDTSGYVPRVVKASAEKLAGAVERYLFISTISVYDSRDTPNMDESAAVGTLEDPTVEQVNGQTYGPLKALCEQAAEAAQPERTLTIRPGLIVGPGDTTDRYTYWPVRATQGGTILGPGDGTDPVQYIDVRDLAQWSIAMLEKQKIGTYNATGPVGGTTIGDTINACRAASGVESTVAWVDAEFLGEHGVAPWQHMPTWVPPTEGYRGFGRISIAKAVAEGMTTRPIVETARDTITWWNALPAERRASLAPDAEYPQRRAGISAAKEKEVLAAWAGR